MTKVLRGGFTILRHTHGIRTKVLRGGLKTLRHTHGTRTAVLRGGLDNQVDGMGLLARAGLAISQEHDPLYKKTPRSPDGMGCPIRDGLAVINYRDAAETLKPEARKKNRAGVVVLHDELSKIRRPVAGT